MTKMKRRVSAKWEKGKFRHSRSIEDFGLKKKNRLIHKWAQKIRNMNKNLQKSEWSEETNTIRIYIYVKRGFNGMKAAGLDML